jgi:hypothetical protein
MAGASQPASPQPPPGAWFAPHRSVLRMSTWPSTARHSSPSPGRWDSLLKKMGISWGDSMGNIMGYVLGIRYTVYIYRDLYVYIMGI